MDKISVGIIGIGHLGERHLKVYQSLPQKVKLAWVCDINPRQGEKLAKDLGIPFYTDYHGLLAKVDAVNICAPTSEHFSIGRTCLSAGLHTFIEKPIASTVEQAEELTRLAHAKRCTLQVGHVERFNAAFQAVKRLARNPLFIECHRLNRFPKRSLDIGVVMDLMIHDIDIVLGLIEEPVEDIHAVGINVLTGREDIANARLSFQNGCVCNLTASRVSDEIMRKIRIFIENTYISLDYVRQEAFVFRKSGSKILKHALPIEKEEPLKVELESFIDCIRNDERPLVSGEEGTAALKTALAIVEKICRNPLVNIS